MGIQIVPEFEREVFGAKWVPVEGKDLARAVELNPQLLAPLLKFSSITAAQSEELGAMEEQWEEMAGQAFPIVEWFEASQGIVAVQQILHALINDGHLLEFSGGAPNFVDGAIEDLRGIERNLWQASAHEIRFHLAGEW